MPDLATHIAKLDGHPARFRENRILNLIGGQDQAGAEWFETRSPVNDSLICRGARSGKAEIDAAARSAKAAFPAWAALTGETRKKILHNIAELIVAWAEEIALCECWDTGQAYRFMSRAALRGAENFPISQTSPPARGTGNPFPHPII